MKFVYKNENGQTVIEAVNMDLIQLAAEVGQLCNNLYNSLYNQEPEAADFFKTAMIMTIAHPDSPAWMTKEQHEGDVSICLLGKKPN